ncbi:MAG: leucine-rich repeat protein [Prevotella sp.]|nr:leucine-rich repeat protein [Prevotella sp.]
MVQRKSFNLNFARAARTLTGARRVALLLVVMLLTMTAQTAWAQQEAEIDGIIYILDGNDPDNRIAMVIPKGGGYSGDIIIPPTVTVTVENDPVEYRVTNIRGDAFNDCEDLQTVNIGENVQNISDDTFNGCSNLTAINVDPGNGNYSSLEGVLFNKDQTTLVKYPAGKTASESYYLIPDNVTSVADNAFAGVQYPIYYINGDFSGNGFLHLGTITCNNGGVTVSGTKVNDYYPEGTEITLAPADNNYAFNSVPTVTCSEGEVDVNQATYTFTMPAYDVRIEQVELTRICGTFGYNDDLTWTMSDEDNNGTYETLTITGTGEMGSGHPWENAFKSSITTVIIEDGVTSIGASAFHEYTSLASVTFGENSQLTTIGDNAFYHCAISGITIPASVTSIGASAFHECTSLATITIPASVTSIGASAFYNCTSLATITIPDGVTSVGSDAFGNTPWLNNQDNWEDGIVYVGKVAYKWKGDATSADIKDGTVAIAPWAFSCASITSVTIPTTVTNIGEYAFNASDLTSVTIPASVESIGDHAFISCTDLTTVYMQPTTPPTLGSDPFFGCNALSAIVVPAAAKNDYETGWSAYSTNLKAGYTVTCADDITATSTNNGPLVQKDETVALQWNGDLHLKAFGNRSGDARFTVTKSDASTVTVSYSYESDPDGEHYLSGSHREASFTMPAGDVTISARAYMPVPYIDASGNSAVRREDYTILTSESGGDDLPGGWYVAKGEFTIDKYLHFADNSVVHFILCDDDANITVNDFDNKVIQCSNLTIYGQTNGTGSLTCNATSVWAIEVDNLTICGGHVTATTTGCDAIQVNVGDINLNGGTLTATANDGTSYGIYLFGTLCLKGGTVESTGEIYARNGATITLASGKCYTDGTNIYTTSISRDDLLALGNSNSMTLTPAQQYTVTLDQQDGEGGTPSVTAAYGAAMPAITLPTKTGYDFKGYFTAENGGGTKYYNADGTSARTWDLAAATPLYAYWETITFEVDGITYVWTSESTVKVAGCTNSASSITIPTKVDSYDVTEIGEGAFMGNEYLVSIDLSESDSPITTIGNRAFKGCTNLSVIHIPSSLMSIGNEAFSGCDLTEIVPLPSGVKSIGEKAFSGSGLEEITIPATVTSIGRRAFADCANLTSVIIPDGVGSIADDAFEGCNANLIIYVPEDKVSDYSNKWPDYTVVPEGAIPYIAANGSKAYRTENTYTVLTGSETCLGTDGTETWYVVNSISDISDINYNHPITLNGNVNLILADGCTMNVTVNADDAITSNFLYSLTIYGQSAGTGTLTVTNLNSGGSGISVYELSIYGGTVNAKGCYRGIDAFNVYIHGGTVNAEATGDDGVAICADSECFILGGKVSAKASGNSGDGIYVTNNDGHGQIKLGWSDINDQIYSSSFNGNANNGFTLTIDHGKAFTDGTNIYTSASYPFEALEGLLEVLKNVTLYPRKDFTLCTAEVPDQLLSAYSSTNHAVRDWNNIIYKFEDANNPAENGFSVGEVVKDGETVLTLGTDYKFGSVNYIEGDGTAAGDQCRVEIIGQGEYAGSIWEIFTIISPSGSGTWGDNNELTWSLTDGALSISLTNSENGNKAMKAAAKYDGYPWYTYSSIITSVTIGEGITSVADYAFAGTYNMNYYGSVETVSLPSTLISIGDNAFAFCTGATITIPSSSNVTYGTTPFNQVKCVVGTLSESADNTALIELMSVAQTANVTLSGRTLKKDGSWNTLCLPFDIDDINAQNENDEYTCPLHGATIMEMNDDVDGTSFNITNGEMTLRFMAATDIEAGKPYIVKWATAGTAITDPVFTGVKINADAPEVVTSNGGSVTFKGSYSPYTNDVEVLLKESTGATATNAFHAFVKVNDQTSYAVEGVYDNAQFTGDKVTTLNALDQNNAMTYYVKTEASAPVEIAYVDENGTTQTVDAIVLDPSRTSLVAGTYVVNKDITFANTVTLEGDVTLILADGGSMTIGTSSTPLAYNGIVCDGDRNHNLTIYGQSEQTGSMKLYVNNYNGYAIAAKDIAIYGGKVAARNNGYGYGISGKNIRVKANDVDAHGGTNAIFSDGILDISGCQSLRATLKDDVADYSIKAGDVTISDGRVTVNGQKGLHCSSLDISGGEVNVVCANPSTSGIYHCVYVIGDATISGGQVNVSSTEGATYYIGIGGTTGANGTKVTVSGGQITVTTANTSTNDYYKCIDAATTISFTDANDFIKADSYGSVTIADGTTLTDGTVVYYSGDLSNDQKNAVAGKTLQPITGVTLTKDGSGNVTATLDPTSEDEVSIPVAVEVDHVEVNRTYESGKASTVYLPFSIAVEKVTGGKFHTFTSVKETTDPWEVTYTEVPTSGNIEANTPYIFLPDGTNSGKIVVDNGTNTVSVSTANPHTTTQGLWEFIGTHKRIKWTHNTTDPEYTSERENEIGSIYGFAANDTGTDHVGDFVKVDNNVWINPMRAYLKRTASSARAMKSGAQTQQLPDKMRVVIVKASGETTEIGTLDTRTGEISLDEWYSLDGRRLSGKHTKSGLYINNGKKVLVP